MADSILALLTFNHICFQHVECLHSCGACSKGVTCCFLLPRSYLTPVRDEEAESLRKARSRQARQTRRSTQVSVTSPHYSVILSFCLSSGSMCLKIWKWMLLFQPLHCNFQMSKAVLYRSKFITLSPPFPPALLRNFKKPSSPLHMENL